MKVFIIKLRSLIIGVSVFLFVLIAALVLLLRDPLDVSSSYSKEEDSIPASANMMPEETGPKPTITLDVNVAGTEAEVKMLTDHFAFTEDEGNPVHGQGHAHVYLDGQLLKMLHSPDFKLKKLPKGEHVLRVELAYSNHLPYRVAAEKIINIE
ncbi:hypothetical protein ACI7RC_26285 [Brevibacillus sp. B_LB10_24]|uniref:hypothetical protein n=1 Tax=Brevibacillus sp. B_LB10_24 TaxID=3380645 RepID=UPI0038B7CF5E